LLAQRVHAAVLVCVKTAAILGAVLSLGSLKEEDYMRLVKQSLEGKIVWSDSQDASIPGLVLANPRLSSTTEARSSPPSVRGRFWWIGLASSLSKRPHTHHQRTI